LTVFIGEPKVVGLNENEVTLLEGVDFVERSSMAGSMSSNCKVALFTRPLAIHIMPWSNFVQRNVLKSALTD
jgi:hypothetical protein